MTANNVHPKIYYCFSYLSPVTAYAPIKSSARRLTTLSVTSLDHVPDTLHTTLLEQTQDDLLNSMQMTEPAAPKGPTGATWKGRLNTKQDKTIQEFAEGLLLLHGYSVSSEVWLLSASMCKFSVDS